MEADDTLFQFQFIDYNELHEYPTLLQDVYNRKVDGAIIQGALTQKELTQVLGNLNGLEGDMSLVYNRYKAIPRAFAMTQNNKDLGTYFRETHQQRAKMTEMLGFDIEARIHDLFGKIAAGKDLCVPEGITGEHTFSPGQYRYLEPDISNLGLHCGNYFIENFPHFYDHLTKQVKAMNQLSYFIMLQEAELGGELTVYNLEWDNYGNMVDERALVHRVNGTLFDINNPKQVRSRKFTPKAGDLVVFAGGPIWHRVELVKGSSTRITYGGFMAFSHDNEALYYWC